jgi:siroheme synthase
LGTVAVGSAVAAALVVVAVAGTGVTVGVLVGVAATPAAVAVAGASVTVGALACVVETLAVGVCRGEHEDKSTMAKATRAHSTRFLT